MKELYDLLDQKERKILAFLCILVVLALLFYFFIGLGKKNAYSRTIEDLSSKRAAFQTIDANKKEQETQWKLWQNAVQDMEDLGKKYFFAKGNAISQLRRRLQKIFRDVSLQAPPMRFEYSTFEKEEINKVLVTFNITSSYAALKRFIHAVERLPKFLVIERIDFLDIDSRTGRLRLKAMLAGYYEN
jgi:Tfp pilus assembly protein PilO